MTVIKFKLGGFCSTHPKLKGLKPFLFDPIQIDHVLDICPHRY